jgi:hypothetical protein
MRMAGFKSSWKRSTAPGELKGNIFMVNEEQGTQLWEQPRLERGMPDL